MAKNGSIRIRIEADDKASLRRLEQMETGIRRLEEQIARTRSEKGAVSGELAAQTAELERQQEAAGKIRRTMIEESTASLPELREGISVVSDEFQQGMKSMLRFELGVRGLFSVFDTLRSYMDEGIRTYALYDEETRANIRQLQTSLQGLQSSFADAFAPILNTVAPILSQFIDWLASAISAVSMFFALLSGKTTYKKAVTGLNNTAAAASRAGRAAKAARRNFSGLDELNIWDSGSSSGGGGGGGSSGSSGGGLEFVEEEIQIPGWMDDLLSFWDRIRDNIFHDGILDFSSISLLFDEDSMNGNIQALREKIQDAIEIVFRKEPVSIPVYTAVPEEAGAGIISALATAIQAAQEGSVAVPMAVSYTLPDDLKSKAEAAIQAQLSAGASAAAGAAAWLTVDVPAAAALSVSYHISEVSGKGAKELIQEDVGSAVAQAVGLSVPVALEVSDAEIEALKSRVTGAVSDLFSASGTPGIRVETGVPDYGDGTGSSTEVEQVLDSAVEKALLAVMSGGLLSALLAEGAVGSLLGEGAYSLWVDTDAAEELESRMEELCQENGGSSSHLAGKFQRVSMRQLGIEPVLDGVTVELPDEQQKLDMTAKLSKSENALSKEDRTIKTWSSYAAVIMGLTNAQRTIKTWSSYSAAKMNLTNEQRTIKTWSAYSAAKMDLTNAQRTIRTWANYTAGVDSIPSSKKTLYGYTTNVSDFNDKIPWIKKILYNFRAAISATTGAATGGVFAGGMWHKIQSYASGGYVGGQLFVAREAGPELVGTLKGHTAVMNNDQIVASVSAGVARAIAGIRFQMTGWPAVTPELVPAIALGEVVPPKLLEIREDLDGIRATLDRIASQLSNGQSGGDINVSARVRERVLFDMTIEQGRLYKAQTGRNPFDI